MLQRFNYISKQNLDEYRPTVAKHYPYVSHINPAMDPGGTKRKARQERIFFYPSEQRKVENEKLNTRRKYMQHQAYATGGLGTSQSSPC